MRLRWECIASPSQLLFLPLFLRLLVLLSSPHNKRHLDRRRRTSPPQWRDPCISSFALAVAFAFLLLPLPLLLFLPLPLLLFLPLPLLLYLPLLLLLLVLRRHSERSEESPHFQ